MEEIGRGVSDKLLVPFTLAGQHLMGTACNVLVIKAERLNGMFLLSTAWNIGGEEDSAENGKAHREVPPTEPTAAPCT